jgi:hypothetical protein
MKNSMFILLLLPLFWVGCEKSDTELSPAGAELSSSDKTLKRGPVEVPGCRFDDQGKQIVWDFSCFTAKTGKSPQTDNIIFAHEVLDDYFKWCYFSQRDENACDQALDILGFPLNDNIEENNQTGFNAMDFGNQFGFQDELQITHAELQVVADAIYQRCQQHANTINQATPGTWKLTDITVAGTEWDDCYYSQKFNNYCAKLDYQPIQCGASWFQNVSWCFDVCETRSVHFYFRVEKLCNDVIE